MYLKDPEIKNYIKDPEIKNSLICLTEKDPDDGIGWGQVEKGTTEDEMVE